MATAVLLAVALTHYATAVSSEVTQPCDEVPGLRDGLTALYDTTNSCMWSDSTRWGSSHSICTWFGVSCTAAQSKCAVNITLPNNNLCGSLPAQLGKLGGSVLALDLSGNHLNGTLPAEVGMLRGLRNLVLGGNRFTGALPSTLANLTSLVDLQLSRNRFTALPSAPLSLQHLDLSQNRFPEPPTAVWSLTHLRTMLLDSNPMAGTALSDQVGQLASIASLSIQFCKLRGTIPQSIGNLTTLTEGLQLGYNALEGTLPATLGNLTRLTYLDLSSNRLSGTIPDTIGGLREVRYLGLSYNQLTGPLPSAIGRLRTLFYLELSDNMLTAIPSSVGGLQSVIHLLLQNNRLTGTLPAALGELHNLAEMDFSNNSLSGAIPALDALQQTVSLNFQHNNFEGVVPRVGQSTLVLKLGYNRLTSLAEDMESLSSLSMLDIQNNHLSGTLPETLAKMTNLRTLLLHHNRLHGTLSSAISQLRELVVLNLASNAFVGSLPSHLAHLTNLVELNLASNALEGPIPAELQGLRGLQIVSLQGNRLTGPFPDWTAGLTALTFLELSANNLEGTIPEGLGKLTGLKYFGAGRNKLRGTIPEGLFSASPLAYVSLERNALKGVIPQSAVVNGTMLQFLHLANNHLTGRIPAGLNVSALLLHSNQLRGSVPTLSASALLLHDNWLSCRLPSLPHKPTVSVVLPGSQISTPLPSWLMPAMQKAILLAVSPPWEEYLWTMAAGGPALLILVCFVYKETSPLKTKCKLGALLAVWTACPLLAVMLGERRFECGRVVLRFSIGGLEGPLWIEYVMAVLFMAHFTLGAGLLSLLVVNKPRVLREKLRGEAPTEDRKWGAARKALAVVLGVAGGGLLCIPSGLYSASHSLPPTNVLGLDTSTAGFTFGFSALLAPLSVLCCVTVGVPKLARFCLELGWGSVDPLMLQRLAWGLRAMASFGVPIVVLLVLDQGCGQLWTQLWCGCTNAGACRHANTMEKNITRAIADGLRPVLVALEEEITYKAFSDNDLETLAADISPCSIRLHRGRCTRRVIEVLFPLLLSKLVVAAVAQPVWIILQSRPLKHRPLQWLQQMVGGLELCAATRLAELHSRLIWIAWMGFATPPLLLATAVTTVNIAGALKHVTKRTEVRWIDICEIDSIPLLAALVVAYMQAIFFWVDNHFAGLFVVIATPLPAGAVVWWVLRWRARRRGESVLSTETNLEYPIINTAEYRLSESSTFGTFDSFDVPAETQSLPLPPRQCSYLGVRCTGVTSLHTRSLPPYLPNLSHQFDPLP